jgi:Cap4-like dsDNA endonuclease family protein
LSSEERGPDLELSLSEDSGSETLARYEFQEQLCAHAVVEMLADSRIIRIICESDEDYVIHYDIPEFVSVKHREPDQGAWTIATVCSDGGLPHLFATWREKGKSIRCRLQTNAGLKSGKTEARALAKACADSNDKELDAFAEILQQKLGADSVEDAKAFLLVLRIQDSLPKREDLRAALLERVRARAASIGWPEEVCQSRYDVVCGEVRKASRSDVLAESRAPVVPVDELDRIARRARAVASKTIDRERVLAAIREAERPKRVPGNPLVEQKLLCGGVGPTGRSRARELQQEWLRTKYRWSSDLPDDALEGIRRDVLRCAEQAERRTRDGQGLYGVQMQVALEELLRTEFGGKVPSFANLDVVMGLAYDETDRCNISWCDDFVPEAES